MSDIGKIDALDLEIVEILRRQGRLSAAEIADRVGNVTERTIRNRINSLVERRLLFLAAVADPQVFNGIYLDLMIDTEPSMMAEVANMLVEYDQIEWVGYGGGDHDVYASMLATSKEHALAIVEEIDRIPGIQSVKVTTHLAVLKTHGFRLRAATELRARIDAQDGGENRSPSKRSSKRKT